jgi:hypothetical protein
LYPITISPFRKNELGNVVVPPGDPGEQLIANVILSVVACQLHSVAAAKPFILRAYALALQLADKSLVYRPPHPSKFVRLVCQIGEETESVLYSVIDDILVLPAVTPGVIARGQPTVQPATLLKLEMVRHMIRLRTRKMAAVLEPLTKCTSSDRLSDVAQHILTQSLRHELPPAEPLARANENFTLAHNFIGKRNYPLAALALNSAANALEQYEKNTPIRDHSQTVRSMKRQIALVIDRIKHRAVG